MKKEKRLWIFVAYGDGIPIFSKIFDNHTKMKEFSAEHSAEKSKYNKYSSTYFDLIDCEYIEKAKQERDKEIIGGGKLANPTTDELIYNCGNRFGNLILRKDGMFECCSSELNHHAKFGEGKTPKEAMANLWLELNI